MSAIEDYNSVSVVLSGSMAGRVRYYRNGVLVGTDTRGEVYEDMDGIHFLLPNGGRKGKSAPPGARLPGPFGMSRRVVGASAFRDDLVRRIATAVDDNEPLHREVAELFGAERGTLLEVGCGHGKETGFARRPVWSANFLRKCPEADSFLTWLASYMCNYRRAFRAGERLEGHELLPEVLGDRAWSDKAITWETLMEQAVWIYMEFRKSLLPVQQRVE